ncbi:MAG TPA: DUF1054 domain-containing protein [Bacillota bacterium]|nr:DUF1054 domain-containing protein [Bacillota bacterium]
MNFPGFTDEDFNVFTLDGLDNRMNGIKQVLRPKLEHLGSYFSPLLSTLSGDEMFYHVAKHARRTVNPPKDTWVAWAANKRGYKMLPHFQVGLWRTHLFVWFAIIYEAQARVQFAKSMLTRATEIHQMVPNHFYWSWDHMRPEEILHQSLTIPDLEEAFVKLRDTKKAEVLCGILIDRDDPILRQPDALVYKIEETLKILLPLYKISQDTIFTR